MKTRAREIARVGIFGSKDDPQIVTEKDLLEIAETFPDIKTAPVVFGHWPSAADPRLGNVTAVTYHPETKSLTADIQEDDALAGAVDAGYYPDVSIRSKQRASDGKMYLVHLAYLGQEAPAIKDLVASIKEPLGIAASETEGLRVFPSPLEKRLYLSDTPPEKNFFNSELESAPKSGAARPSSPKGSAGAAGGGGDSAKTNEEVTAVTEEEAQKLREENERLKAEAQAKDLALSDAARRKKAADRERLKAAMDSRGIPRPVQEKALLLSDALDEGKTIELSDAEAPEGKRKIPAVDCLIEIVSAFTKPVETGALNLSDGGDAGSAGNAGAIKFSSI
jgi:hypothetical protein